MSGLSYPPGVVPELEPWMEQVRVVVDRIDEAALEAGKPQIIFVDLNIDGSGNLTAIIQGNSNTESIKFAASKASQPTIGDVRAEAAVNGQTHETGTLLTLEPNETGHISVLGYAAEDGLGDESELFATKFIRGSGVDSLDDIPDGDTFRRVGDVSVENLITTASFAQEIEPVEIVTALPDPVLHTPPPHVVYLTTDKQIYRFDESVPEWTREIQAIDLTGEITETQIADDSISTPKLQALAVTAEKIAANTITADQIAANTITAGEIAAGAIGADEIAAQAVIASKMLITDFTNPIPNPVFRDGSSADWELKLGTESVLAATAGEVPDGAPHAFVGKIPVAGGFPGFMVQEGAVGEIDVMLPVSPGEKYLVSFWAASSSDANEPLKFHPHVFDESGTLVSNPIAIEVAAPSTTWQEYSGEFTVTSTGRLLRLIVQTFPNASPEGAWYFTGARMRKVSGATLIEDGAIITDKIAANAIIAEKIAAAAIQTIHLDSNIITAEHIQAGVITSTELANLAVIASKIDDGAVETAKLANLAVDTGKIADFAIVADKIAANAIVADKIAANAVVSDKIAANAIVADKIASNQITATHIAADTITASQIASNTITASEIAAGTITASQIASNTITASEIAADTITASQIAAGTITGSEIAADTITATHIAAGTITSTQIAAGTITASEISADTITTNELDVLSGTMSVNNLTVDGTLSLESGSRTIDMTGSTIDMFGGVIRMTSNTFFGHPRLEVHSSGARALSLPVEDQRADLQPDMLRFSNHSATSNVLIRRTGFNRLQLDDGSTNDSFVAGVIVSAGNPSGDYPEGTLWVKV